MHHGLPEFIAGLGAAVISEDAIPHGGMDSPLLQGLRVRNQWTYPARLYRAAAWVGQANHAGARVELVQITSFGCGLDAITTDQVRELLRASGKLYTLIKMDEGNALASARIRIRSLLAVTRSRSEAATAERAALLAAPTAFTRHHAASHTILVPQMAPLHFPLLVEALEGEGHQVRLLPEVSARAVDLGQAYVNNISIQPSLHEQCSLLLRSTVLPDTTPPAHHPGAELFPLHFPVIGEPWRAEAPGAIAAEVSARAVDLGPKPLARTTTPAAQLCGHRPAAEAAATGIATPRVRPCSFPRPAAHAGPATTPACCARRCGSAAFHRYPFCGSAPPAQTTGPDSDRSAPCCCAGSSACWA